MEEVFFWGGGQKASSIFYRTDPYSHSTATPYLATKYSANDGKICFLESNFSFILFQTSFISLSTEIWELGLVVIKFSQKSVL